MHLSLSPSQPSSLYARIESDSLSKQQDPYKVGICDLSATLACCSRCCSTTDLGSAFNAFFRAIAKFGNWSIHS
jgi:hypothetical protein